MSRLLHRYQRVLLLLVPRAGVWAGALVTALLAVLGDQAAAGLLGAATVGFAVAWRLTHVGGDRHLVARALIAAAALALLAADGRSWLVIVAGTVVLGGLMVEPVVGGAIRSPLTARGVPGLSQPVAARIPGPLFLGCSLAVIALCLGVGAGLPGPALWVALVLPPTGLAVAGYQLVRVRRRLPEIAIRESLTRYAPDYCIYYSGHVDGAYQVRMWLPYLARTGRKGMLLIRNPEFLDTAVGLSDLPVVLARRVEPMEFALVPSVGAVFYVNNDAKNADCVRYGSVTHVHLGHGDSDKPASYAATTAMFDRIFVAGQAGVDRFARHGVIVPREKFELVGRPQLETLDVRPPDASLPEAPVVLYAPTWRGSLQDSLFGSLWAGERIVSALIDAGARVWFRPHPYSRRDAESRVLIARIDELLAREPGRHVPSTATAGHTVFECMNASDAMVTDVSSLASDYLYSNKPFAITQPHSGDDLTAAFPVAGAAVVMPLDADLTAPVAELLGADVRREARANLRSYYLGDWPADDYARGFMAAAARAMDQLKDGSLPPPVAAG